MKRLIIGSIIGLALGLGIGLTSNVIATPPPSAGSTEQRLQSLENLRWQKNHVVTMVSQRVFDRHSSCNLYCYETDRVLLPFTTSGAASRFLEGYVGYAIATGTWDAQDNGNGDSWTVTLLVDQGHQSENTYSWTVWESNGFIQGVY
jgi:hypothetical protein